MASRSVVHIVICFSILLCYLPPSNLCDDNEIEVVPEAADHVTVAMTTDEVYLDSSSSEQAGDEEVIEGGVAGMEAVEVAVELSNPADVSETEEATVEMSILPMGETVANSSLAYTLMNMTDQQLAANLTEKAGVKKVTCVARNITENDSLSVSLVNSTELLQKLTAKNESRGYCSLVLFYAPWCVFCAKTAPHYNALARAFPQLEVMAIDAIHFNNLNARFGTIAVPNILLFHNTKAVARFNHSSRALDSMVDFVKNITGLEPNVTVEVTELDYEGPLPSTPTLETDYLLWASWVFVIVFFAIMLYRSRTGQRVAQLLASFGQEHHHQHID